jgi:hypothetical protein
VASLSIVLLAILALMGAAFVLPLAGPRRRGWRPAPGSDREWSRRRETPAVRARRLAAPRRRRVLLSLTVAVVLAVRAWYVFGGRWWIAEVVTGALLVAYVGALVALGLRRHRPARAARRRPAAARAPSRRRGELPLWSGPLLEGQAPSRPE